LRQGRICRNWRGFGCRGSGGILALQFFSLSPSLLSRLPILCRLVRLRGSLAFLRGGKLLRFGDFLALGFDRLPLSV
jgi:hypothetical protein